MQAIDRLIIGFDRWLNSVEMGRSQDTDPSPGRDIEEPPMTRADRADAAGLMRVNHAGEVAAQALYHGQAFAAKDRRLAAELKRAAAEEGNHLAWCRQRLKELDSRPSHLDPLWYAGSFLLGAVAGAAGSKWSLGFMAETERQVEEHLQVHLGALPAYDKKSRAVILQMQQDEIEHRIFAENAGAHALPEWIRSTMKKTAKVMTKTAYWI